MFDAGEMALRLTGAGIGVALFATSRFLSDRAEAYAMWQLSLLPAAVQESWWGRMTTNLGGLRRATTLWSLRLVGSAMALLGAWMTLEYWLTRG
ncbi:MAG: hypothetical protein Q7W30_04285 [Coriobacteriia bacterium]|nr:hypothetical protein [Coriobacteriia bacterium]